MPRALLALMVLGAALLTPPAPRAQDEGGYHLTLSYDGRLLVKVLDIQIEQRVGPRSFSSSARLVSSGILRLVRNIDERAIAEGRIAGGEARPGVFEYQRVSSKTHRRVRTTWSDGDVQMTTSVPFKDMGFPPATPAQKLASADPLTVILQLGLKQTQQAACPGSYRFFDGKQAYAVDLYDPHPAVLDDDQKALGLTGPFACSARFRRVAGFGKPKPGKPDEAGRPILLDLARVGEHGPWIVTRLRARTPLGSGVIEIRKATLVGRVPG